MTELRLDDLDLQLCREERKLVQSRWIVMWHTLTKASRSEAKHAKIQDQLRKAQEKHENKRRAICGAMEIIAVKDKNRMLLKHILLMWHRVLTNGKHDRALDTLKSDMERRHNE